jgi:hypothetical protein
VPPITHAYVNFATELLVAPLLQLLQRQHRFRRDHVIICNLKTISCATSSCVALTPFAINSLMNSFTFARPSEIWAARSVQLSLGHNKWVEIFRRKTSKGSSLRQESAVGPSRRSLERLFQQLVVGFGRIWSDHLRLLPRVPHHLQQPPLQLVDTLGPHLPEECTNLG